MKINQQLFAILGTFFLAVAIVYTIWTRGTEWVGIPALFALAGMQYMIAYYLRLVEKEYKTGVDDKVDGEIEEYSGTYGRFALGAGGHWAWRGSRNYSTWCCYRLVDFHHRYRCRTILCNRLGI